jgi:hypothetical protein
MTRRRPLLLSMLAVVLALAAAWLVWPCAAITRENVQQVKEGMTLAEVEAILGGPVRDETTGPVVLDEECSAPGLQPDYSRPYRGHIGPFQWKSDQVMLLLYFDAEGHVADRDPLPLRRADESLLARLRRWLHV